MIDDAASFLNTLKETVTRKLPSLQNWVYVSRLTINYDPEKSSFLSFVHQLSEASTDGLKIHNNILAPQNKTAYLGSISIHPLHDKNTSEN